MNKADLIEAMAKKADITKVAAEKALNAFLTGVTAALKKKDRVSLVGFGSFAVSRRAARKGRNPQTGQEINIKAANVPKFRAGAALKSAVK
ncbi:MAG: HU family DNA-binding protein [Deltaproteobacteria bacterium]|nr:HU family DNA-binding protein [Deltaproteobacteria bacterium]